MSIAPRPEPAPCMVRINCESLDSVHKILSREDDISQTSSSIATLSVRDPVSFWDGRQGIIFSTVIKELSDRRVSLPEAILKARTAALKGKGRAIVTDVEHTAALSDGKNRVSLRHLQISSCKIQAAELGDVIQYTQGNAVLSTLSLKVNGILPTEEHLMTKLAQAISLSNLRILELANNPLGTRSVVQLIDNLDCPSLTQLTLSMTMQNEKLAENQKSNPLWLQDDQSWKRESSKDVWKVEIIKVAESVAKLVSNAEEGKGGYAPRLERLALNGNDLNWKSIRIIVDSILQGNRNLSQVELFGTTTDDDSADEKEETRRRSRPRARSNSIGSPFLNPRHNARVIQVEGSPESSKVNTFSGDMFGEPNEPLSKQNWRFQLGRHLWKNRLNRMAIKEASRYILPIARTLACKCRPIDQSSHLGKKDYFAFTKLPSEIRIRIIHLLDEKSILSDRQFEAIISFASNPATLGLGCYSKDLGLSSLALQQIYNECKGDDTTTTSTLNDYGLLPHRTWNWINQMQISSPCRDWPATVLDETMRRSLGGDDDDHRDIQGLGGGGPDGRGGLTLDRKPGPDATRRRWLEEQSGLHAFWETTGTYREE